MENYNLRSELQKALSQNETFISLNPAFGAMGVAWLSNAESRIDDARMHAPVAS
jgi:hypothetical protein